MQDIPHSSFNKVTVTLSLLFGTPAVMIAASALLFPEHRIVAILVSLVLGMTIGFFAIYVVDEIVREEEVEKALKRAQAGIEDRIEQKTANTVDIALLNMRKLDEYYVLNKQQARQSFNVSIGAVVVGFATLIVSAMFFADPRGKFTGALAGVLLQFIGGGFFYLYNKSLDQLNLFYAKLINLQNTMLALQLCEKLTTTKEETMKTIALELMERSDAPISTVKTKKGKIGPRTTKARNEGKVAEAGG